MSMKITTYYQDPIYVWHKKVEVLHFWQKEFWVHIYATAWVKYTYYKGKLETFLENN